MIILAAAQARSAVPVAVLVTSQIAITAAAVGINVHQAAKIAPVVRAWPVVLQRAIYHPNINVRGAAVLMRRVKIAHHQVLGQIVLPLKAKRLNTLGIANVRIIALPHAASLLQINAYAARQRRVAEAVLAGRIAVGNLAGQMAGTVLVGHAAMAVRQQAAVRQGHALLVRAISVPRLLVSRRILEATIVVARQVQAVLVQYIPQQIYPVEVVIVPKMVIVAH